MAGKRRGWVLAAASVASFMVALDLLVVTTSLDTIRRDLGTSTGSLQWIVTAYGVSFAALLLTGAALGDRFGRRRTMSIGLAVFALGSAGAALAPGVGVLDRARDALQGVGGAIVLPIGLTIVASVFPPSRRGTAIGILEGVTGLAVIAGPVVGGAISQWLPWQWIFWINVPIALVAIVVVRAVVEETFGPDKTIDLAGLVLVSIAATATVLALARGNTVGWASAESIAVAVIGLVVGDRASSCGSDGRRRRCCRDVCSDLVGFPLGVATAFFVAASLYVAVFFMAQYLQAELGVDSFGAGLRLLPWTATLFVTAPLAGALADRVGYRAVLSFGLWPPDGRHGLARRGRRRITELLEPRRPADRDRHRDVGRAAGDAGGDHRRGRERATSARPPGSTTCSRSSAAHSASRSESPRSAAPAAV